VPLKFHIETFGCQMNKSDSEAMALSMLRNGFEQARSEPEADIVIFNTCSVREHAENRALSRFRSMRRELLARGGTAVLAGCMAQRIGSELAAAGEADLVVGPYQSPQIGDILAMRAQGQETKVFLSQRDEDFAPRTDDDVASLKSETPWHKWVTITHGCENYCAYCIVPSVRGRLISFPSGRLLQHIAGLASRGVTEITLLGQNVNQYGMDSGDIPFSRLLEAASKTPGLQRLSFLTSHPRDFTEDIIDVIRDNETISRAIHLPLQSGSDAMLAAMNRGYDMKHYLSVIEQIDTRIGDYSISTDLIVGFPGESPADFAATIDAVRSVRFDTAFTYAYSPRQGTPAFSLKDTVPRDEKISRLQELIAVQREIGRQKLEARVSRVENAIVGGLSKRSPHEVIAMTFLDHPVILPGGEDDFGKKLAVKIESISGTSLLGSRI
jgi:tRNA-2-methylthio-N6-dimethylallyladenosine synthase